MVTAPPPRFFLVLGWGGGQGKPSQGGGCRHGLLPQLVKILNAESTLLGFSLPSVSHFHWREAGMLSLPKPFSVT